LPISEDKIAQITSRSEYFQDILQKIPPGIIRWASTGILLILILLGLGFKLVKYPDTITSNTIITTERPPVEVYSRSSGRIAHLLKKDQGLVKNGDWVIILSNSANYSDVLRTIKLLASIDTANFWKSIQENHFNGSVTLGEVQNTYFQFTKSIGELEHFIELNSQYRQLCINSKREEGLVALTQKLGNQLNAQEKQFELSQIDYDRSIKFHNEGFMAKAELEQKEIAYLAMKNKVEELNENLLNTQLQKDMLDKENTTLDIEKKDTYYKLRTNVLQNYNALLFELSEWKNKYVLAAPIDGVINFYDIRSESQFLPNETKAFTIAPQCLQSYFALVKLAVLNSGKVRIGQKCVIKVHNYAYSEYGLLKGIVMSISSAPREGFYSVKVKLPEQLETTLHKRLDSKGELTGEAEIIVEDMSLFDRLFNSLISKNY